jgi:hypothetical protein
MTLQIVFNVVLIFAMVSNLAFVMFRLKRKGCIPMSYRWPFEAIGQNHISSPQHVETRALSLARIYHEKLRVNIRNLHDVSDEISAGIDRVEKLTSDIESSAHISNLCNSSSRSAMFELQLNIEGIRPIEFDKTVTSSKPKPRRDMVDTIPSFSLENVPC